MHPRFLKILSTSSKPKIPSVANAGGIGRALPSKKLLRRHLLSPEEAILRPAQSLEKVRAGVSKTDKELLVFYILTADYEAAKSRASDLGLSGEALADEIREICRPLIEDCMVIRAALAIKWLPDRAENAREVIDGLPRIIEIAGEFGLEKEKEAAAVELCKLLLFFGAVGEAARVAVRELPPDAWGQLGRECPRDADWMGALKEEIRGE